MTSKDWLMLEYASSVKLTAVFISLYCRYRDEKKDPGADRWIADEQTAFPIIFADIKREWLIWSPSWARDESITEGMIDDWWFPYNQTFMKRCWASFRRLKRSQKQNLAMLYEISNVLDLDGE